MATLKELNNLNARLLAARTQSEKHKRLLDVLHKARTGDISLTQWIESNPWHKDVVIPMINEAIDEFAPEILRVLELRQEALARKSSAEASVIRAQLAALVDEEEQAP